MRARSKGIARGQKLMVASLGAIAGLTGCGAPVEETEAVSGALLSENGMTMNGMTMNGMTMNGMTMNGMTMNGLSLNGMTMNGMTMNGLATVNGLSSTSGLMVTAGGRQVVKYMVKCAFPLGRNLVQRDQYGVSHTFEGALGVAPELETGTCNADCQERVSACMLAHVNNAGVHIGLWLDSEGAIGWGTNPDYPYQEGSFFGNLFPFPGPATPATARDTIRGRCPAASASRWRRTCTPTRTETASSVVSPLQCLGHGTDGYDRCTVSGKAFNHVVTVWRNYDPNTVYKICNVATGKCLGATSTLQGAQVEQRAFANTASQKWWVTQHTPGKYRITNLGSGKVLDQSGITVVQKTFAATPTQLVAIKSLAATSQYGKFNLVPSSGTAGVYVMNSTDGAIAQLWTNLTADMSKWTIAPVGTAAPGTTAPAGANPCASFCAAPTMFTGTATSGFNSGNLGVGAVCSETMSGIVYATRSNMAGRTFSVNGVAMPGDGAVTLPPPVNGGYCFQVTAGGLDNAGFSTF